MKYYTRKKLTYEYINLINTLWGGNKMSRFYCRDEELRKLNKRYENTVMKKSVWTNWNWFGNMQQSLEKEQTTTTTFSRKADLRTDYFRHRNAEKYSCLPLPIFLNNTRNALAGVKLAGAFLVEVIIKDLFCRIPGPAQNPRWIPLRRVSAAHFFRVAMSWKQK